LEKTRAAVKQANPKNRNLRRGTANWPELEELKTWILDQRSGIAVSTKMIIHRARLLATDRNIIDFTGSPSWCFIFIREIIYVCGLKQKYHKRCQLNTKIKLLSFTDSSLMLGNRKNLSFHR
jgi:hypothetical protein